MKLNVDFIYPVGSIYISVSTVSPSTLFGGTWEQITSDAYLKIVDSNAGSLGGTSSDHKIPLSSMPSHGHGPGHQYFVSYGSGATWAGFGGGSMATLGLFTSTASAGGGKAYYPYYYGVYVWKRTN